MCAPATEAQRSYPGKAAHRNDKNKGAAERKRAAKVGFCLWIHWFYLQLTLP